MRELLADSMFFGCLITTLFMKAGYYLVERFHIRWIPPIILDLIFVIALLQLLGIRYEEYYQSAQYIGWLLTPATVSLAIPLYRQRRQLQQLWREIFSGVLTGILVCMLCILLCAALLRMTYAQYVTLLPKSITAAISMVLAEEWGGFASITVISTTLTGAVGNIIAQPLCRRLHITEPVARGVAIGTSSHALGTAKALEIGETEGAISGLSMALAGLFSVVLVPVFAQLWA